MNLSNQRIAVLVSNDLQGDSRVEKIAKTLGDSEAEVVVFGLGSHRFPVYVKNSSFGVYRPPNAINGHRVRGLNSGQQPSVKLQLYRLVKFGTIPGALHNFWKNKWNKSVRIFTQENPGGVGELEWRLSALEFAWKDRLIKWAPTLIHANDSDTIGIAVRAAEALRAQGKTCRVVYDQHEYLPGMKLDNSDWRDFMLSQETSYISKASAVLTVSEFMLDDLKERYELSVPSATILNAPSRYRPEINRKLGTVRSVLELERSVPLHVYVGILAPKRGLHTAIEALPSLPTHHIAIVTRSRGKYFEELVEKAQILGVEDRLHWLPYVPFNYVTTFISDATCGLATHVSVPAHEVSLGTKIYEYVFAGIPIVSSDGKFRTAAIKEHHLGEIFTAENSEELAAALMRVVSNGVSSYTSKHSELVKQWCWESQASKLIDIYCSIIK